MGPGKRQGGFLLLDGVLACFLLAAGALTLMLGLRMGVRMIRLQRNLETASREGTALLEEEGLPWGETGERTLTRTPRHGAPDPLSPQARETRPALCPV